MIRSLAEYEPNKTLEADVIIVGAGLSGLFLANSLSESNLRILILESGKEKQLSETHELNAVETLGDEYKGATKGRFRCLGGSSTRWGGALLPYLQEDLRQHPCGWHLGWGIEPDDLEESLHKIESIFGVKTGTYEQVEALGENLFPNFKSRLPKWPVFNRRNSATLFKHLLREKPNVEVWIDSTVTEIRLGDAQIRGIKAESLNGKRLDAVAPTVVLAAGAIETTRMLLLLNRAYDERIFPSNSPLGYGFHDHLSAPIADFLDFDFRLMTQVFGFRFVSGGMRNLRFELSPATRVKLELPAAFLHVAFTRDPTSGFEGLRGLFQSLQQSQFPKTSDLYNITSDLPWFLRAIWWRFIKKRVLPPTGSGYELHLVTEQCPSDENRISLSKTNFDVFGLPQAKINWTISELDFSYFHQLAELANESWRSGSLDKKLCLSPRSPKQIDSALRNEGGIYHPAGTTRIGQNSATGVVDSALNVHEVSGLRVLSTSTFPSVGGSSPSLALLQFASRMSADILASFQR